MPLPTINAIWIGRQMGPVHAACLASFIRTDHTVILHAYGTVEDAPHGVRYADANRLRPEDKLIRYANGSPALSSNLMRYELLRQGLGLYVDCDVYCVAPLDDAEEIYGWENEIAVNSAVLKLPQDSPVLAELLRIGPGWIAPWWSAERLDEMRDMPWEDHVPWGATGPRALTHFLGEHGRLQNALPTDVLYPVPYQSWRLFYDPSLGLEGVVKPSTRYVHLYNEMARQGDAGPPPPGSALDWILRRENP